ncbi:MAG: PD40 domain-containing protein [Anaerolineae bacterium]|nr:PD40 domain-containing protein [Anaerolineae bacterium]
MFSIYRFLKIGLILICLLLTNGLPQPSAAQGLAADGPWLVYLSSSANNPNVTDQVIAINADGTGSTVLAEGRSFAQLSASKAGYVAFLGSDIPANGAFYQHLTLYVMQLPSGKMIKELPLTNAKTAVDPKAEAGTDFPSYSITDVSSTTIDNVKIASMSWSPDGKTLAYMGAELGTSVDLYTYRPETDTKQRLSDANSQAVRPVWSPEGKYIVHLAISGLGTGAGYGVGGMWSAYADNSRKVLFTYNRPQFNGVQSGDELIIGWRNKVTFWVVTWTPATELAYLRSVNLGMGDTTMIWDESLRSAAADLQSGTVLISKNAGYGTEDDKSLPGLHLYTSDGKISQLSTEDKFREVVWAPASGHYYVEMPKTEHILAVTPDGQMTELAIPALPQVLKVGGATRLAWAKGTTLNISDDAGVAVQSIAEQVREFVVVCPAC